MIIVDLLMCGCAVYILFLTLKMKKTGVIPQFLVSPRINLNRAKDTPGFINYMFPRLIIYSIAVFLFAAVSIAGSIFKISPYITVFTIVAFFVILVYYCVITIKAQNRYLF